MALELYLSRGSGAITNGIDDTYHNKSSTKKSCGSGIFDTREKDVEEGEGESLKGVLVCALG